MRFQLPLTHPEAQTIAGFYLSLRFHFWPSYLILMLFLMLSHFSHVITFFLKVTLCLVLSLFLMLSSFFSHFVTIFSYFDFFLMLAPFSHTVTFFLVLSLFLMLTLFLTCCPFFSRVVLFSHVLSLFSAGEVDETPTRRISESRDFPEAKTQTKSNTI